MLVTAGQSELRGPRQMIYAVLPLSPELQNITFDGAVELSKIGKFEKASSKVADPLRTSLAAGFLVAPNLLQSTPSRTYHGH